MYERLNVSTNDANLSSGAILEACSPATFIERFAN